MDQRKCIDKKDLIVKKYVVFFLIIILCFLCGCRKSDKVSTEKEYIMSVKDMQIILPLSQDGQFLFENDRCIFHSISNTERYELTYYSKKMFDDSAPEPIGLSVMGEGFIADYLKTYLYILRECTDGFELISYDTSGNLRNSLFFTDSNLTKYPCSFAVCEDESFAILCEDEILLFSPDGQFVQKINDSKYTYKTIVEYSNGCIYVKASKKNDLGCPNCFLVIDDSSYTYKEISLFNNIEAITAYNNYIYFISEKIIYSMDLNDYSVKELLNFMDERGDFVNLYNVIEVNENIVIIKNSASGNIFRENIFSRINHEENNEVIKLTFYKPKEISNNYNIDDIVESFNEENSDICIEIKEYDRDINYILTADNPPDLIVNYESRINELSKAGYLSDLSLFLEKSEYLKKEDFIDGLIDKIEYNDGLYGIPRYIGIRTLGGAENKLGKENGWTVNEFLDWLISRPESLRNSWMQKEDILKICLEGSVSEYKDYDYASLLQKVNEVKTYPNDGVVFDTNADIITTTCEAFTSIPSLDSNAGGKFVFKGYPSSDGKPRYTVTYVAVGMFENCEYKEEAYKFIEYYVTYRYGERERLYSTKKLFSWAQNISGTINLSNDLLTSNPVYMSEDQLNRPLKALPFISVLSEEESEIIDIIVNESSLYFSGDKSLEDTAEIIQRRVGLYIAEHE